MISRVKHYLLTYSYVEDMELKRTPVRPEHLRHIQECRAIKLAGALLNPVDTGVLIFECETVSEVDNFIKDDPYYRANLVVNYTIREFAPVVNNWLTTEA